MQASKGNSPSLQSTEIMNLRHDDLRGENFGLLAQPRFTISQMLVLSRRNRNCRGRISLIGDDQVAVRRTGAYSAGPSVLHEPRPCAVFEHTGISSQNAAVLLSNQGLAVILGCRGAALTQGGTAVERRAARSGLAYVELSESKGINAYLRRLP